jgi:hypothetical protein
MSFHALVTSLLAGIAIITAIVAAAFQRVPSDRGNGVRAKRFYWFYAGALIVVVLTTLGAWGGFYFASRELNFCAVLAATVAYCYFSFASFAIRPRFLGIVAGAILTAPVILITVTIPFTGLALGFILHDANTPYAESTIPDGQICRTREYGMAASDEGREVELLRSVGGVAYRKVFETIVPYSTSSGTHTELCALASTQLRLSQK